MKPQFITDAVGNRTGVILSIKDYERLMNELDETHVVKLYDEAKRDALTFKPLTDALKDI